MNFFRFYNWIECHQVIRIKRTVATNRMGSGSIIRYGQLIWLHNEIPKATKQNKTKMYANQH